MRFRLLAGFRELIRAPLVVKCVWQGSNPVLNFCDMMMSEGNDCYTQWVKLVSITIALVVTCTGIQLAAVVAAVRSSISSDNIRTVTVLGVAVVVVVVSQW